MKSTVETLCRQHGDLRTLADSYEQELRRPAPDLAGLAKCRWTLARLVSAHLAFERVHLYGTLASRGDVAGLEMGKRLDTLGARLSDHVRIWTPELIGRDWAGYARASIDLIRVLRDHMDEEERSLYPRLLLAKTA